MGLLHHFGHAAANNNTFFSQHSNAVADGVQTVEIVRYHKDRHAHGGVQPQDQLVKFCRTYGVKSGGGLVELLAR